SLRTDQPDGSRGFDAGYQGCEPCQVGSRTGSKEDHVERYGPGTADNRDTAGRDLFDEQLIVDANHRDPHTLLHAEFLESGGWLPDQALPFIGGVAQMEDSLPAAEDHKQLAVARVNLLNPLQRNQQS